MMIVDQNKLGDKLIENKFRFFFRYIPNNFVLQQENIFTGRPIVKGPGIRFLFGFSQARQIKPETVDFNMQRIDAYGNQDVMVDLAVTFEIEGGLRYEDESSIKSENKINRRAWAINHGLHKFIKDEIAIREDIQRLKEQVNHKDTDSKTGILESSVKDVIRKYLTGKKFDDIKKLDEKSSLSKDDNSLKDEIVAEIDSRFREHGLRVISVDFKNIKQSEQVNELEEKRKIAEKNIEISKLQAQAYAEKRLGEAKADAEAIELRGQAEAKNKQAIIDATVKAYGDKNVDEINAINGNRVTYNKVDLGGIIPNIGSTFPIAGNPTIGGGSNPGVKKEVISDPMAEVMRSSSLFDGASLPTDDEDDKGTVSVTPASDEEITRTIKSSVEKKSSLIPSVETIDDDSLPYSIDSMPIKEDENISDDDIENTDVIEPKIDSSIFEDDLTGDEKDSDEILLPAQNILEIEASKIPQQDEVDNTSSKIEENDDTEPELFDEKPSLSDSQIEKITYSDEQNEDQPYSHRFFSSMEDIPVVEEESKTSEDIDILKSMKSELTSAMEKSDASDFVTEDIPVVSGTIDNLEDNLPEIEVPKESEESKVEEKPKGLNLDFINSTWGRK